MKHKSVSLVIPAFNEEKTIKSVAKAAIESGLFSEIICVDDGSTDNTLDEIKSVGKKVTLLHFKKNSGKGAALKAGIKKSTSDLIMFADADLIGIRPSHFQKIYSSMINNGYSAVLGSRSYSYIWFVIMSLLASGRINPHGKENDEFTGERIYYRKDLLPYLETLGDLRFGAEAYLNKNFENKKIGYVNLDNLKHRPKHTKLGWNLKMVREIVSQFKSMNAGRSA